MTARVFIVTTEEIVKTDHYVMAENEEEAKKLHKDGESFDEIEVSKEKLSITGVRIEKEPVETKEAEDEEK